MYTTSDTIDGFPLKDIPLFRFVPAESLEGILQECRLVTLEERETLLVPGQENRSLFILLSGMLRVHLNEPDSDPLAFLAPGEVAGELSVLDGEPASAYVIAERPCRLLAMDHHIVWSLVGISHAAACNLLTILSRRLRSANEVIIEKMLAESSYHRYGTLDVLTGMHNRHWLDGVLPRLLARATRTGTTFSSMMVDIDYFKEFNDTYGHLCGDRAIHTVSRAIIDNLRPMEMGARFGGDEFVILLPGLSAETAGIVADRLLQKVRDTEIVRADGGKLPPLTISIGIVESTAGETAGELLGRADAALYRAKELGRDTRSF